MELSRPRRHNRHLREHLRRVHLLDKILRTQVARNDLLTTEIRFRHHAPQYTRHTGRARGLDSGADEDYDRVGICE